MNRLLFIIAAVLIALVPSTGRASGLILPDEGQAGVEELASKNPLGEDENIKSTLIAKNSGMSMHLVQIRKGERPHIHKGHDLLVTLKKGKGVLHLGGKDFEMAEGDTAFIPMGVVHYFENTGEGAAAGIGVFIPPFDGKDIVPVDGK